MLGVKTVCFCLFLFGWLFVVEIMDSEALHQLHWVEVSAFRGYFNDGSWLYITGMEGNNTEIS